ncbi:hypothetical protein HDU67_003793, partial [Dinochytrium kinnereticum]
MPPLESAPRALTPLAHILSSDDMDDFFLSLPERGSTVIADETESYIANSPTFDFSRLLFPTERMQETSPTLPSAKVPSTANNYQGLQEFDLMMLDDVDMMSSAASSDFIKKPISCRRVLFPAEGVQHMPSVVSASTTKTANKDYNLTTQHEIVDTVMTDNFQPGHNAHFYGLSSAFPGTEHLVNPPTNSTELEMVDLACRNQVQSAFTPTGTFLGSSQVENQITAGIQAATSVQAAVIVKPNALLYTPSTGNAASQLSTTNDISTDKDVEMEIVTSSTAEPQAIVDYGPTLLEMVELALRSQHVPVPTPYVATRMDSAVDASQFKVGEDIDEMVEVETVPTTAAFATLPVVVTEGLPATLDAIKMP